MKAFRFIKANSAAEAFATLEQLGAGAVPVAGGTDLLIKMKRGLINPQTVVDLTSIAELKYIREERGRIRIGALTPLAEIASSPVIRRAAPVLAEAAALVGSKQIRNIATIGGNLCNAAPSADTAAPLLLLNAQVRLAGANGERELLLSDFFKGPGKNCLNQGELMTEIFFEAFPDGVKSVYLKHTRRRAMDVATVGVAALSRFRGDKELSELRLALAAVAPTPILVPVSRELIANLNTHFNDESVKALIAAAAEECARPIDDVRASAAYRRHIIRVLTVRALNQMIGLAD